MRLVKILAVLVLAGLANYAFWALPNQPVALEAPPGGKLKSVSFAPFRDGQSPLTYDIPTREEIDGDLAAIAPQVAGIRTYSSVDGLDLVPELAGKHGITVTMGAWLSPTPAQNEREIDALIDLANRYPDVITRVIVGNEVLLRRDLPVEEVIRYIDRVKAAVKQPVSYADVWEWWIKYPQVADHVDFLTIHLLPYWEDVPASVDGSTDRIRNSYRIIAERFPGKPILVGETGWPTAGRNRGAAQTGLVSKARFVNNFIHLAEREGFDYNIIEAFDQNWKAKLEGTVGAHWGLYDNDRKAKFSLAGPVVENPHWMRYFIASGALAFALWGWAMLNGPRLTAGGAGVLALIATGQSAVFARAVHVAIHGKQYWDDLALAAVMLSLVAVLSVTTLLAARRALAGGALPLEPLAGLGNRPALSRTETAGRFAALVLAMIALAWGLLIVLDGRYRDFPNAYMATAVIGLLGLGAVRAGRRPEDTGMLGAFAIGSLFRRAVAVPGGPARSACGAVRAMPFEAVLAAGLMLSGLLTVLAEGFVPMESILYGQLPILESLHEVTWTLPNWEALGWALLQILLAVPFAAPLLAARRDNRARTGEWARGAAE